MIRLLDALTAALFALACLALGAMLLSYLIEVALRYFFDAPTRWSSDVVAYALLFGVAFSLPTVTRDGGHVAITSVIERLSPDSQRTVKRLLGWLSAGVCLAASGLLASQAVAQWRDGIETVAAFAVPKWWLSASVALGLALSALHFLQPQRESR